MSKKVIIYIKNKNDPSSYYRVYQYFYNIPCKIVESISLKTYNSFYNKRDPSSKFIGLHRLYMGIEALFRTTLFILMDLCIWHSDTIIINRKLFARKFPLYGRILLNLYLKNKNVYWDFDDNIIYDKEITLKEKKLLEYYAKKIVVTNSFLKNTLSKTIRNKVFLLPTTDKAFINYNLFKYNVQRSNIYKKQINLVWVGSKNNLNYIKSIVPILEQVAHELFVTHNKKMIFYIICNDFFDVNTKYLCIEKILWTRSRAIEYLNKAHIGIMPLIENEYTKGKGSFKAIQYIGAGIPVLLSPVGYNKSIIMHGKGGYFISNTSDWKKYILKLSSNIEFWKEQSQQAIKRWEEKFNPIHNEDFWMKCISYIEE